MEGTSSARSESGQVATWLVLLIALALVGFGTIHLTKLARGADEAAGLQVAADAAALAGAQSVADDAPLQIARMLGANNPQDMACGLGREKARDFALRNGASVVGYCYDPVRDEVEVTVRSNHVTETGSRESARAKAEVGLPLGPCTLPDRPEPSPSSSTSSSPTPSPSESEPGESEPSPSSSTKPTPPPDVETEATCGGLTVDVTFPGDGGDPIVHWESLDLDDLFNPRLLD